MKKRRDISRERMHSYYESWKASGMSMKGFANSQGISVSTFYYWCKKFSTEPSSEDMNQTVGFEPVSFDLLGSMTASVQPTAIVRLPSGVNIEWYKSNTKELFEGLSGMNL